MLPGQPQKVDKIETTIGKEGTIELPVIHEHTTPAPSPTPTASEVPKQQQQQQQKQTAPVTFKPRKVHLKCRVQSGQTFFSKLFLFFNFNFSLPNSKRPNGSRRPTANYRIKRRVVVTKCRSSTAATTVNANRRSNRIAATN